MKTMITAPKANVKGFKKGYKEGDLLHVYMYNKEGNIYSDFYTRKKVDLSQLPANHWLARVFNKETGIATIH